MLSKLVSTFSKNSEPSFLAKNSVSSFANKVFLPVVSGLIVLAPSVTSLSLVAQSSEAAPSCQCTTYVANRNGLARNFPNAADWNDGYLQRNGFRQGAVRPGMTVVMERSFPGANGAFGHVGIVESIDSRGRITVRGANQSVGSRLVVEANCSNVRSTQFGTSINGRRDISFWAK